MLRQIKTFIGFQVLELEVHTGQVDHQKTKLPIILKWRTKEERTITRIDLVVKEMYSTGRWTRKHKQTLLLGKCTLNGPWHVNPEFPVVLNAEIPFDLALSPLDTLKKKMLLRPIALALGWIENVESQYYLEITTTIQGAALPVIKKIDLPGMGS